MESRTTIPVETRRTEVWTGRVMSGLAVAFLLLDAVMKLIKPAPVVTAFRQSGWPIDLCVPIGIVLLACTVVHVIPRTAVVGALLLTAYLGGAVATNLRLHNPLFSYVLVPVYVGMMIWGGLLLRVPGLRRFVRGG